MSHGSKYHRGPGALSAGSSPARILKGRHLPGRMGFDTVAVQNLEIVKVDAKRNLLLVKGALPGPKGTLLTIKNTVKN